MAYTFQKVYTLIAQTPMIHFQYDQKGATLRATEVKPKLDRYLLQCAADEKIAKETLDSWHIGYKLADDKDNKDDKKKNEYKGLHYQMKIERKGRPEDSRITLSDCKFYFGNQGDGDKKELVFNNCELQIVCFIPALMEFIDKHIGAFFALHNFGTRQTKGFGGFRIKDQSDENIATAIRESNQLYFYADMPAEDQNSVLNRMNHALTIYSVMKNGLNMTRYNEERRTYRFSERYIKGCAMRPYLDQLGGKVKIGSDKAFIKSRVHAPKNVDSQEKEKLDRDYRSYTFIRALLGLAEQYEFRDRYRNNGIGTNPRTGNEFYEPVGVSIINCPTNENGTPNVDLNQRMDNLKKEAKIQRFASPVTIKIYQNRIYFLFNDSYKQMLSQTFLFLSFRKRGRNITYETVNDCLANGHYLSTPKSFDMKAFVEYFVSYYNTTGKEKLKSFIERNSNVQNPYENSRNLTLKKGW